MPSMVNFSLSRSADGTVKLSGRDHVFRTSISIQDYPARGKGRGGESDGSQPLDTLTNDSEVRNTIWSIAGSCIHRHHFEPGVHLSVTKEELFPIFCDTLTWSGEETLLWTCCRKAEEMIIGTLMANRSLSESWADFTQFTFLNEKPLDVFMWSGRRLTKIQATSRPDHLWREVWSGTSKAAERKEKQQWAIEKPKLDNARKFRGIYFYRFGRYGVQGNHAKRAYMVGIANGISHALQGSKPPAQGVLWQRIRHSQIKVCMHHRSS